MGIKARLLALVLMVALPVLLLELWSALDARRGERQAAEQQLLRSANLFAAQQAQIFRGTESLLGAMLAGTADLWRDTDRCNARLLSLAAQNPVYTGFSIATADGTLVCSSFPDLALVANVSDRGYFQSALATGTLSVGTAVTGSASGRPVVGIAMPTTADGGVPELIAIAALDLSELSEIVSGALTAPGVAVVFDATGAVLARSADADPSSIPDPDLLIAAGDGSRIVRLPDPLGIRWIWAVSPLGPLPELHVAIGAPEADLLAGAEQRFWREMAVLAVVVTGAAIAAWLFGERSIRRPLNDLGTAVDALRRGELPSRAGTTGSAPELVGLGNRFAEMAEAIHDRDLAMEAKNQQLSGLAAERELLVREMSHRVKNSLQLVASLIALQRRTTGNEGAKSVLAAAEARVAAVARVHDRLYREQEVDHVDGGRYLEELCGDLADSTSREGAIVCRAEGMKLSPDRAIHLGIIATELATNAVRHAYADRPFGPVEVEFAHDGTLCRLSVSDRGRGLPSDFEHAEHKGIGLKVVRALIRQLGARLEIDRLEPGTRFRVEIPSES